MGRPRQKGVITILTILMRDGCQLTIDADLGVYDTNAVVKALNQHSLDGQRFVEWGLSPVPLLLRSDDILAVFQSDEECVTATRLDSSRQVAMTRDTSSDITFTRDENGQLSGAFTRSAATGVSREEP